LTSSTFDLVVIGGGPGGYVAAIRAAQRGLSVACVDKNAVLGGTCLRVGCIPSKAMLESSEIYHQAKAGLERHGVKLGGVELDLGAMLARKDQVVTINTKGIDALFKKHKITRYEGVGRFTQPGVIEVEGPNGSWSLHATKTIIATGSKVAPLKGVELDGDRIGTSTEGLAFPEVPGHLVVIGAGYIGMELGSVWLRLGAKVTVVEYLDRILPGLDAEIAGEAHKLFKKQGFEFQLGRKVTAAKRHENGCVVECADADPIHCDRVLLAVGRQPNTEGLALEKIGLELDEKGRIPVNEHFETAVQGVYAIGDVIRGPMLAHKAEDEGVACADFITTSYGHVNYDAIPAVVYTHPEIATVGKTEEQLVAENVPYRKGKFAFRANGRARTLDEVDGFVKVLAHAETDRVLGVRAGDLIAEAAAAMEFGATSEDIGVTSHAHPTLSEALKEAALAVSGAAIHA
jgi:dihydrolipoamide dehydrogenase